MLLTRTAIGRARAARVRRELNRKGGTPNTYSKMYVFVYTVPITIAARPINKSITPISKCFNTPNDTHTGLGDLGVKPDIKQISEEFTMSI